MIRKENGGHIVITCDGCGQIRIDQDGSRAKFRPYTAVWKEAQAAGWTAKKKINASDWNHFCKDCIPF